MNLLREDPPHFWRFAEFGVSALHALNSPTVPMSVRSGFVVTAHPPNPKRSQLPTDAARRRQQSSAEMPWPPTSFMTSLSPTIAR
jgi:hypothetical protein